MQVTQSTNGGVQTKDIPSFGEALAHIEKQAADSVGVDRPTLRSAVNFSSAGLLGPDGQTRDPFPPALMAYLEIIRSIAAYLREQGVISGGGATQADVMSSKKQAEVAETVTATNEVTEADEPTTFAIGEEDHDCSEPGATPAIGDG